MSQLILERLRDATRSEHCALERRLSFLLDKLSADQYRNLLAAMYGFYLPWENGVRPWRDCIFGPEATTREKTDALIDDLQFYDVPFGAAPVCTDAPEVGGLAAALGCMYVMEGATLGGQLIARSIEKQLGLSGGRGYRFFRSYGARTGAMWRSFQHQLGRHSDTSASHDEIVGSAAASFTSMGAWLAKAGF